MSSRRTNIPEQVIDALDRCLTASFRMIARVSGKIPDVSYHAACEAIVQRHPLLSASVVRREGRAVELVLGHEKSIGLTLREATPDWQTDHVYGQSPWLEGGPRAKLEVRRHGSEDQTLILELHHLVSDGRSGVVIMRDLLTMLGEPGVELEPIPSPGQVAFFPPEYVGWRRLVPAIDYLIRHELEPKPARVLPESTITAQRRQIRVRHFHIAADTTRALGSRARAAGATLHGWLSAALAASVSDELVDSNARSIEISHAVDMRPRMGAPLDVVGYYVGVVRTRCEPSSLERDARSITNEVHERIRSGELYIVGAGAGALLPLLVDWLGAERAAELIAGRLATATCTITNLGDLEARCGLRRDYGRLRLESLAFTASNTVLGTLMAAISAYRGELTVALSYAWPTVSDERARRIVSGLEGRLSDSAATESV